MKQSQVKIQISWEQIALLRYNKKKLFCIKGFSVVKNWLRPESAPLSEFINFYSSGNHQKTVDFLMVSGWIEVNYAFKFA